jgi:tRNA nucleotidyltransferase (CCA-adding enzyme)
VVEDDGTLVGFITLRDIMKGRRADQMHAPAKGYMTRKVIVADRSTTVREIEELLLSNNIGHLPILENGDIVGIVTRTDYLAFRKEEKKRAKAVQASLA